MKVKRFRDLTFIEQENDKYLVIACDSSGAIGDKVDDVIKVPAEIVGYYGARVALMEILSVGAKVFTVIDTLAVEMEPTGRKIIDGIQRQLKEAGMETIFLNGSTEENIPTRQTGMGITIIGEVDKNQAKINKSQKGDYVVVLGIPKVGNEINIPVDNEICSIDDIKTLLNSKVVREIYPVGSKGILYEANYLAKSNNMTLKIYEKLKVDIEKSGGPATILMFTISPEDYEKIRKNIDKP
ncbi:MAG: alpha-ribazole-5-phosphate synthase, partial [Clostridiales bacterium]|nr:alpha-ribazole-5-phosphate synthase [Clostridiales bacterium]